METNTNTGPDQTQQVQSNPTESQQTSTTQPGAAAQAQPQDLDALRADYEAKLAETQRLAQVAEQKARHFQSEFDRLRTGAQALTGNEPQGDPMAPYLKKYAAYEESVGRDLARIEYERDQQFNQLRQQFAASLQGTTIVGDVLGVAYSSDPTAFSDAAIQQHVRNELNLAALNGRPDLVTTQYALALADIKAGELRRAQAQQGGQRPAAAQSPPLNIHGILGPQGGVGMQATPRPMEKAPSPEQLALRAKLEKDLLHKTQTSQPSNAA